MYTFWGEYHQGGISVASGGLAAMHCGWEEHKRVSSAYAKKRYPRGVLVYPGSTRTAGQIAGRLRRRAAQPRAPLPQQIGALRFRSAATSKLRPDCFWLWDYLMLPSPSRLPLFLSRPQYFCREEIISFNHTYLIAAIGAPLMGPWLSSVMITRLCFRWAL